MMGLIIHHLVANPFVEMADEFAQPPYNRTLNTLSIALGKFY
jgi:hypothetical protein